MTGRRTSARTLFEDSLRLAVLAAMEDEVHRIDGLIGWLLDGVKRTIGLYREAEALGIGTDHGAVVAALETERRKMIGYRDRRGSGRRVSPIFSEQRLRMAALDADRSGAWWLHEVGDQMVHGNYFAHRLRHYTGDDNALQVAVKRREPRALVDIIAYAVESTVVSHQSICTILDLPQMPALDASVNELERLQGELGG